MLEDIDKHKDWYVKWKRETKGFGRQKKDWFSIDPFNKAFYEKPFLLIARNDLLAKLWLLFLSCYSISKSRILWIID